MHKQYWVVICQAELHLFEVTKERSLYKNALDTAKESVHQFFSSSGDFIPPPPAEKATPCSRTITAHYSFDMAQQVFYPNDPLQPGPMYFLTPRKCAIFGVCCEAIPHQVNYLIDEAVEMGKGANAVVSMLHHFFLSTWARRAGCPPPCRQLWGSKQKQHHGRIPAVACAHRAPQQHHPLIHDSWPYQVLTRLVFWPPKEEVRQLLL